MITRVHGSRPHLCGIAAHKKYGSTEVKSRLVLKSFVSVTTPMFFFFLAENPATGSKEKSTPAAHVVRFSGFGHLLAKC